MRNFSKFIAAFMLAWAPNLLAQTPAPGQSPGLAQMLTNMLPMFAMVFLIFYLLVFKPQQKKLRDHQILMEALKKGDTVITSSGIIGRVAGVEKDYILVEIANNTRVKFERSHIVKKEEKEAATQNAA
jgi:preprotein translocase subunit YajC